VVLDKELGEPILRHDFGPNAWRCPITSVSVSIQDKEPPEGCVYSLEHLMYNQRSWKMWLKEWWVDTLSDFGLCKDERFPLK
jgi:hypothetical protein